MRGVRRCRWLRVLASAMVVAVVACGDRGSNRSADDGPSTSAGDGVVPFERRPARIPDEVDQEPAPADVAECTADEVTFEVITAAEVLGSEPGWDEPDVRNVGLMARPGERCALSAYPSMRLTSSTGTADELVPDPGPTAERPSGGRLLLQGRQRVVGILRWNSSCVPPQANVQVESQLASGDIVSARLSERPNCDPAAQNTTAGWIVYPAPIPDSPVTVTLVDVPDETPFDGTLSFTVALSNPSPDPVSLHPCPVYRATFGESGTAVFLENELNCAHAPEEIPPQGELRFAVEMRLPADEVAVGFTGGLFVTIHFGDGSAAMSRDTGLRVSDT